MQPRLHALFKGVVVCPVDEFLKAGGGCRCLTLALDVSPAEASACCAVGLPSIRIGRCLRVPKRALMLWIDAQLGGSDAA